MRRLSSLLLALTAAHALAEPSFTGTSAKVEGRDGFLLGASVGLLAHLQNCSVTSCVAVWPIFGEAVGLDAAYAVRRDRLELRFLVHVEGTVDFRGTFGVLAAAGVSGGWWWSDRFGSAGGVLVGAVSPTQAFSSAVSAAMPIVLTPLRVRLTDDGRHQLAVDVRVTLALASRLFSGDTIQLFGIPAVLVGWTFAL